MIKENDLVVRNAYIGPGRAFEFNLPNGTYQTFFYFGNSWDYQKYMKETSCGSLYGGFKDGEQFAKDSPRYLKNDVLTYELELQNNGNFWTTPSNINEIF